LEPSRAVQRSGEDRRKFERTALGEGEKAQKGSPMPEKQCCEAPANAETKKVRTLGLGEANGKVKLTSAVLSGRGHLRRLASWRRFARLAVTRGEVLVGEPCEGSKAKISGRSKNRNGSELTSKAIRIS
jgi:hypothetical protein